MAGYTLWYKKRSSDVREQLGIFNINDKLTQYKINWREHIQRMNDNRLQKKINYKPEERRNVGRPQTIYSFIQYRYESFSPPPRISSASPIQRTLQSY